MDSPLYSDEFIAIAHGDCLDVMRGMEPSSIDAIVTDPPYGLGFMGRDWDHGVPGEHFWREALRVAKPGAHLVAFGGDRTHHRLACAIEDAGWEIRTTLIWAFGQGFPKSLNVSAALDARIPANLHCACEPHSSGTASGSLAGCPSGHGSCDGLPPSAQDSVREPVPSQGDAPGRSRGDRRTDGLDSAQAHSLVPLSFDHLSTEDSSRLSALLSEESQASGSTSSGTPSNTSHASPMEPHRTEHRTRGTSDSACDSGPSSVASTESFLAGVSGIYHKCGECGKVYVEPGWGTALKPAAEFIILARKPLGSTVAACVQQHGTGALNIDATRIATDESWDGREMPEAIDGVTWGGEMNQSSSSSSHPLGRWPANVLHDNSPEVQAVMGDSARFFWCPKASTSERDDGMYDSPSEYEHSGPRGHELNGDGSPRPRPRPRRNTHPTVKPVALMRWLVRLVTPPGGVVLDPFMGSGTTLIAARAEGFKSIGIDLEEAHCAIAKGRMSQGVLL